ncbi:MAG: HmuY family protein [Gemmatimonadaceae bacterium]
MPEPSRARRSPVLLWGTFAVFLGAMSYLIASSVSRKSVASFTVSPVPRVVSRLANDRAADTVTVDASDARAWRYFDFKRASVVFPPDTSGWDLAIRRYNIISSGEIADVGRVTFERVIWAPESGYHSTEMAQDTANVAIRRWYRYGMLTHLLESAGNVYVVRSRERPARYVKIQVMSYYCPGPNAGCVTFRYAGIPGGAVAAPRAGKALDSVEPTREHTADK